MQYKRNKITGIGQTKNITGKLCNRQGIYGVKDSKPVLTT